MREKLIQILKRLEAAIPPPPNCHHALMYAQFGSDEEGWRDKLALQVNLKGVFHCLFIEEGDFQLSVETLVAGIVAAVNAPGEFQRGVGIGQFIE